MLNITKEDAQVLLNYCDVAVRNIGLNESARAYAVAVKLSEFLREEENKEEPAELEFETEA